MTCPGASPGANDHLMPIKILNYLFDNGKNGFAASVDHALSANLDNIGVRQDFDYWALGCLIQKFFISQRAVD